MQAIIFVLLCLGCLMLLIKGVIVAWHKMHALVGIEVGHPQEALLLPYQKLQSLPVSVTHSRSAYQPMTRVKSKKLRQRAHQQRQSYWQTRYGRIQPLHYLTNVTVEQLNLMPKQAVELLVSINERMAQYTAWQQQSQTNATHPNGTTLTNWLTEKQFVIDRLISQTIPEAVNQYDQLARFSPQRLSQPIHDDMTAGEVLTAVLQAVDRQMDEMLDEVFIQASSQLATTYRYVKTRTS